MRILTAAKYLWAAPCTALGAAAALLMLTAGATARWVNGVLEVAFDTEQHQGARWLAGQPFAAITLGHVVLARTHACHDAVREHERVHVAQVERWGPLFFVLYGASSACQWLAGRRPYRDNHFERQARNATDESGA